MKYIFSDQIYDKFNWMISELNLKEKEFRYNAQNFGNALIVFANKDIEIRFIKDRSQIYIEFRNSKLNSKWVDLFKILDSLKIQEARKRQEDILQLRPESVQMDELLIIMKNNYSNILAIVNDIEAFEELSNLSE